MLEYLAETSVRMGPKTDDLVAIWLRLNAMKNRSKCEETLYGNITLRLDIECQMILATISKK